MLSPLNFRFRRFILLLQLTAQSAQAGIQFTSPAPGSALHVSTPLMITWTENGVPPLISDMTGQYEMDLCAGGQDVTTMQQLAVLQQNGDLADGHGFSVTIDPKWAGSNLQNAYFVRIITTVSADNSIVITYSQRFSLTGMTGSFNPAVYQGITWLGAVVSGPPSTHLTAGKPLTDALSPWLVPLAQQEAATSQVAAGLAAPIVVYAPMQPFPLTSITAVSASARYASSTSGAWSVATTRLPPNTLVAQTMTRWVTWSWNQVVNEAEVAPRPDDMQMYLKRWGD